MGTAYFNHGFEIELTDEQVESCAHIGDCYMDCLLVRHELNEQLDKISDEDLMLELKEYGAWDEDELKNRVNNEIRIVWIAACNIHDGD